VGHGPHVLRAVEIYKGKPIFYSVANFIFQNESLPFQPQESFDQFNLPPGATTADYFDARSANDTRGFPADQKIWESIVAEAVFNGKRELQEIDLYPITLGFHESRTKRGRPLPATGDLAASIIDRVSKLSKTMGTSVAYQDGKGVVKVAARSTLQSR
jgi:poly-gamma-glutamate synthesis protein (capsule biosynthesis protein)